MKRGVALVAITTALVVPGGLTWAASLLLASRTLDTSSLPTPVMFPMSVTVANKSGGTLGRAQNGDIATLVFSRQIDEPTLCSGWSNASPTQALVNLPWSIVDGGVANDRLRVTGTGVSATCATGFHIGSIDLGSPGYNVSTTAIDFLGTDIALTVGAATTTVTVTLDGQKNGSAVTVPSGASALWTPDPLLKDRAGVNCGSNLSRSSATVQF